jgi:putative SOS response-associated peptidase YedK
LILADGFFEWQATGGKQKQPYRIRLRHSRPFGFAGLWERWHKGEDAIESCTILTTDANSEIAKLHDRMPVVIDRKDFSAWLESSADAAKLFRPSRDEDWTATPVSTLVNNPKNDVPDCVTPLKL